jgi:hypothetical protein
MVARVLTNSQMRVVVDSLGLLLDQVCGGDQKGHFLALVNSTGYRLSLLLELVVTHLDKLVIGQPKYLENKHDGHECLAAACGHEHDRPEVAPFCGVFREPLLLYQLVDVNLVLPRVD